MRGSVSFEGRKLRKKGILSKQLKAHIRPSYITNALEQLNTHCVVSIATLDFPKPVWVVGAFPTVFDAVTQINLAK